jgi:putative oxidoreductase
MFRGANAGLGLLILRVVIGLVFVMHGLGKLVGAPFAGAGMDGTIGFFTQLGIPMPNLAAWGVALAETVGGFALILGIAAPLAALVLAVDMGVAILMLKFKLSKGFAGGYEFESTLLAGLLCVFFAGPGILSVRLQQKS